MKNNIDETVEEVEDTKTTAFELGIDVDFKTFRRGNHKYLELNDLISGLIIQYHLAIQKKNITALSDYQLKRLIKLCIHEVQRRENEEK